MANFLKAKSHPIKETETLQIPKALFSELTEETYKDLLKKPPQFVPASQINDFRNALTTRMAQIKLAERDRETAETVVEEFNLWIMGKHPIFNISSSNVGALKNSATWWGRRRLVGQDFDIYWENMITEEQDYLKALALLKCEIPDNMPKAWLYFIFFVYKWPHGKSPDRMYLDQLKTYMSDWAQGSKWNTVSGNRIVNQTIVLPEHDAKADPQDEEAVPRFIGYGQTTGRLNIDPEDVDRDINTGVEIVGTPGGGAADLTGLVDVMKKGLQDIRDTLATGTLIVTF
jgi:hypothetical protein